jgi:hypothetical protein
MVTHGMYQSGITLRLDVFLDVFSKLPQAVAALISCFFPHCLLQLLALLAGLCFSHEIRFTTVSIVADSHNLTYLDWIRDCKRADICYF